LELNPRLKALKEARVKTGIGGLDERLGGGLPTGSLVLLLSNSETCLRMFSQQVPYNMAALGRKVFYVTMIKEPKYIREEMELYNWRIKALEEKGTWSFVDAYTPKVNALLMQQEQTLKFDLSVLIRSEILSRIEKDEVIVIDSLSDLLLTQSLISTVELLEIISAQIMRTNGLVFLPMYGEMHDKRDVAIISHLADVIVELVIGEVHFEGKIRFWKMRRARSEPLFLPFSITDRGIIAETFTHVV